jgi:hypothetical protein
MLDKEIRRSKWFDVARFPAVRFVTTGFRAQTKDAAGNGDNGEYEATGQLTVRDVTEEVTLPFKLDICPDGADPLATATACNAGEIKSKLMEINLVAVLEMIVLDFAFRSAPVEAWLWPAPAEPG